MKTKQTTQTILTLGAVFALLAVSVQPARADLVGTQVYGTVDFSTEDINAFDPFYGGYAGSLNTLGEPVTISSTATEFGYADVSNIDTADFTGSQLIVSDNDLIRAANWTMTFTDTAFSGMNLSKVSDNFPNGGIVDALNGDVITLTWAGYDSTAPNMEAIFSLAAVPEPTTLTLGCFGGLASLVAFRRRR